MEFLSKLNGRSTVGEVKRKLKAADYNEGADLEDKNLDSNLLLD